MAITGYSAKSCPGAAEKFEILQKCFRWLGAAAGGLPALRELAIHAFWGDAIHAEIRAMPKAKQPSRDAVTGAQKKMPPTDIYRLMQYDLGKDVRERWNNVRDLGGDKDKGDLWKCVCRLLSIEVGTYNNIMSGRKPYGGGVVKFFKTAGRALNELSSTNTRKKLGIDCFETHYKELAEKMVAAVSQHHVAASEAVVSVLASTTAHGCSPVGSGHEQFRRHLKDLFEVEKRPLAFYHWRQTHSALHWVDFYFLRLLKRLDALSPVLPQAHAIKPIALTTDQAAENFNGYQAVVEALVGGDGNHFALSELKRNYASDYNAYADSYNNNGTRPVVDNEDTREVLKIIPWLTSIFCKRAGFMLLVWNKNRLKYDGAWQCPDVKKIAEISSGPITIGGELAKKDGRALLIEPQNGYASIVEWVSSNPDFRLLKQFVDYLAGVEETNALNVAGTYPVRQQLTPVDRALVSALPESPSDAFMCQVNRLGQVIRCWNKEHFSGLVGGNA